MANARPKGALEAFLAPAIKTQLQPGFLPAGFRSAAALLPLSGLSHGQWLCPKARAELAHSAKASPQIN